MCASASCSAQFSCVFVPVSLLGAGLLLVISLSGYRWMVCGIGLRAMIIELGGKRNWRLGNRRLLTRAPTTATRLGQLYAAVNRVSAAQKTTTSSRRQVECFRTSSSLEFTYLRTSVWRRTVHFACAEWDETQVSTIISSENSLNINKFSFANNHHHTATI